MSTVDKDYTSKDILVLSDRDHVRQRTQIYAGGMNSTEYTVPLFINGQLLMKTLTFVPAVYKVVGEILDNSIDEFAQIQKRNKTLKITADPDIGKYIIADNGRGVPIDKHETGKYTPEVVFGSLRSGRNFTDDKSMGVVGQNGVGSSLTNYCSSEFDVLIHRDKKVYQQRFVDGASKVSKPKISAASGPAQTGTQVSFQLDPLVFKDVSLPVEMIRNRAIEIAMTNPDITVEYNNEKFKFKRGLLDLVTEVASDKTFFCFEVAEPNVTGEIFVILDAHNGIDEQMYTWVNSSLLFDGGKCNTQFFNALFERVISHLEKEAKKTKTDVTRNDVRQGLMVLANLKVKNPEYDSQAKTRLTGPDMRKELTGTIDTLWKGFTKRAEGWLAEVLERANERHHKQANKKAIDEHAKNMRKRVPGLLDATSRVRSECQVLITEGESAKSQISEARDPNTTAAFALTGKINNVYGSTPAQVLKMGKITDLLSAIGLIPGRKAMRGDLNYGRIVIATDADYDGDDIFTLLTNLMYQFWPELFDKGYEPIVHRLVAPNVCLVKGAKRVHFARRSDYEKVKDKYKNGGWTVNYYKGLGSMAKEDWEMLLSGETDTLIPIVNDGKMGEALKLLFGDSADARKEWLTTVE